MTTSLPTADVRRLAEQIAREAAASEPSIRRIYWFPHDREVRLVEVDADSIMTGETRIHAFWFGPDVEVPLPSGIALVHPVEEAAKKPLPDGWGEWGEAEVLVDRSPEE